MSSLKAPHLHPSVHYDPKVFFFTSLKRKSSFYPFYSFLQKCEFRLQDPPTRPTRLQGHFESTVTRFIYSKLFVSLTCWCSTAGERFRSRVLTDSAQMALSLNRTAALWTKRLETWIQPRPCDEEVRGRARVPGPKRGRGAGADGRGVRGTSASALGTWPWSPRRVHKTLKCKRRSCPLKFT